jgi:serine/threonine protein kinase
MMKELSLLNSRLDGRYDIQSLLGRGSYAEIYVARDTLAAPDSPHREIVIKALNVFLQNDLDADLERTLVENFQNEAVALDRVRHPNVVSRLGHGTARDLRGTVFHYLVLEYLSGGDLAQLCRQKSLGAAQALKYIEQVCAGLGHAHKCGVIHRDIKPQNLLLTRDRATVKIADFGVARFSASDSPITRVGTNIYAPPEHSPMLADDGESVSSVAELTPAADVYSLAKSVYVLITCESPRFFANQPITELPVGVRQKPWANDLLRVLRRATQMKPKDRHQTVLEFWQDLSQIKSLVEEVEDGDLPTRVATRRPHSIPQPRVAQGYSPLAPQRPQFNTSRDLKVKDLGVSLPAAASSTAAVKSPNLVVRLDSANPSPLIKPDVTQAPAAPPTNRDEFLNSYAAPEDEIMSGRTKPKKSFLRRAALLLLFISVFAGALFVTQSYLRTGQFVPGVGNPFSSQQQGVANTDVNLREQGDADSRKIGMIPKGSRVRVVKNQDNWYEVVVIEYGRAKESPTDADRGWVNRRYITVQE